MQVTNHLMLLVANILLKATLNFHVQEHVYVHVKSSNHIMLLVSLQKDASLLTLHCDEGYEVIACMSLKESSSPALSLSSSPPSCLIMVGRNAGGRSWLAAKTNCTSVLVPRTFYILLIV